MSDLTLYIIISILLLIIIRFVFMFITYEKNEKWYKSEWRKWEAEYWNLRGSEAIKDNFTIRLSWLSRGYFECISVKPTQEDR